MTQNILKWTGRFLALICLAYAGYFYYSLATGEDRVTAICNQMTPGMPVDELIRLAKRHGFGPGMPRPDAKLAYLAEVRSYGRHACRVELDGGVVKSSSYSFAD
jgi:hypothetical protein